MKLDIPFELGQEVWIYTNRPISYTKEVPDGYDHLGPKSRLETVWIDNFGVYPFKFSFSLLDRFKLEEIFASKYECEMKQKSAF